MPFGAVRGGIDLHYAECGDDEADDEKRPVEIAEAAVAGHRCILFYQRGHVDLTIPFLTVGVLTGSKEQALRRVSTRHAAGMRHIAAWV